MVNSSIPDPAIEHLVSFPSQLKLWDHIKRNCTAGNKITLVQTEVAEKIGVSRVTICNNLKQLEKLRFIAKNGKHGTSNEYMINPNYVWNGKVETYEAGCAEFYRLTIGKRDER